MPPRTPCPQAAGGSRLSASWPSHSTTSRSACPPRSHGGGPSPAPRKGPSGGFVKLLRLRHSSGKWVPLPGPTHPLGGPLRPCNFGPTFESIPHLFAVLRRGQQMPSGSEVVGNGSIHGQK